MAMNPRLLRPKRAAAPTGTPASLLLRFDGSFADSSPSPLTATPIGNAATSSATVKWGSGSGQLVGGFTGGSTSGVTVADSAAFGFGTGDFTLEGWFYSNNPSATYGSLFSVGTYLDGVLVRLAGNPTDSVYVNGTSYSYASEHGFPTSQWTHVAVVRNAGAFSVYFAGQRKLFVEAPGDIGSSRSLFIGAGGHSYNSAQSGPSEAFVGFIDDIRVVKAAVYSGDSFTPPTVPLSARVTPAPQESAPPPPQYPPYGTILLETCNGDPDYYCCTEYADGSGGSFVSCGGADSYGTFPPAAWEISGITFGVDGAPSASGAQLVWPAVGDGYWGGSPGSRKYVLTGPSGDVDVPWTATTHFMPLPAGATSSVTISAVSAGGTTPSNVTVSITTPSAFSGLAVILTSGTSYAVPSGATSMKAWAVGSGGTGDGWWSFSGNAGGCAHKTWSVSGGQSVAYTRSDNGNSTVTFGGVTITGNAGPRNSRSTTGSGFSGGDGGAAGGVFTNNDPVMRGGAVGGNGSSASPCNRWRATNVSGLFAAVALAGGSTTESCAASAAFGSGGVSGKGVSPYDAGIGGGGVTANEYTGIAAAAPGVGAVVLQFT